MKTNMNIEFFVLFYYSQFLKGVRNNVQMYIIRSLKYHTRLFKRLYLFWYVLKFNPRNLVYRRIYIKALPFVIQQSQHISHCLHKTQSTSLLSVCEKKIYICNAWYKWRQTLSNGIVSHCLNIHLLHSVIPNFLRIRRTKRRRNL